VMILKILQFEIKKKGRGLGFFGDGDFEDDLGGVLFLNFFDDDC
jgi:hypothetical protein